MSTHYHVRTQQQNLGKACKLRFVGMGPRQLKSLLQVTDDLCQPRFQVDLFRASSVYSETGVPSASALGTSLLSTATTTAAQHTLMLCVTVAKHV